MAIHAIKHQEINRTESGLPMYEFQMDSISDLDYLPTNTKKGMYEEFCCPGSIAYTPDLTNAFILSPSGTWTKVDRG